MIKPISSAEPSFRAIHYAQDYMQPTQIEVADRIDYMLTADEFRNAEGKTLEEQAGMKADIFINQPYQPLSDGKSVNVSLAFTQYIDLNGDKFGRRDVFEIGSFNAENIQTFPDEFIKTNKQNNPKKIEDRINLAAIILSGLAMLGVILAKGSDALLNMIKNI